MNRLARTSTSPADGFGRPAARARRFWWAAVVAMLTILAVELFVPAREHARQLLYRRYAINNLRRFPSRSRSRFRVCNMQRRPLRQYEPPARQNLLVSATLPGQSDFMRTFMVSVGRVAMRLFIRRANFCTK